jgi:serine/threonine protein phosphatase 1
MKEMCTVIQNADLKYQNIYVIGDIHGCYSLLMDELANVNFNFEQDLLISVGDIVDKGPQSYKCLELIDQKWFTMVRGNHEELCIQGNYNSYFRKIHEKYGGEWFYTLDDMTRDQIVAKLKKLPIIIELQTRHKKIGILHGDIQLNDWNAFKARIEIKNANVSNSFLIYVDVLWGRSRIKNSKDYGTVKNIDEVYLGHTVVENITQRNNCFYIDTGAFQTNRLSLVKLEF